MFFFVVFLKVLAIVFFGIPWAVFDFQKFKMTMVLKIKAMILRSNIKF